MSERLENSMDMLIPKIKMVLKYLWEIIRRNKLCELFV